MKVHGLVRLALTMVVPALLATAQAQVTGMPEITSQGFDIDQIQTGILGKFGRLRVRIEVPNRISELHIKERSYEVDLANTPDVAHLGRFGLDTRPRQKKDVTLNFENYINEKLETEGLYEILMRVTDKAGQSIKATLAVSVSQETAMETGQTNPISEQPFTFARAGAAPNTGAERFGISWVTVDVNEIIIRIAKAVGGAEKLSSLSVVDYATIKTKEQLNEKMNTTEDVTAIEFATANNGAAGNVLGVVNRERPFILKISESDTSLSDFGTTVTLRGTFKY